MWSPAEAAPLPKKWEETFDVVIVGSGFAGLAAAYEAKKAGASVVVLEKMKTPGGNSIINGGVVAAAGSPLQEKMGIKDSPELLLQDMLKAGLHLNYVELARMVAYKSNETVQWTINELGVQYKEKVTQEGVIPYPECTAHTTRAALPLSRDCSPSSKRLTWYPERSVISPRSTATRTAG